MNYNELKRAQQHAFIEGIQTTRNRLEYYSRDEAVALIDLWDFDDMAANRYPLTRRYRIADHPDVLCEGIQFRVVDSVLQYRMTHKLRNVLDRKEGWRRVNEEKWSMTQELITLWLDLYQNPMEDDDEQPSNYIIEDDTTHGEPH